MTAYAASAPRQATFIVYINGVEVPAKSVSLRYGVWQIPEMQIDMVADPVIARLGAEDRVQVAVFYLDDTDVAPEVQPEFRLFGEGEITGWGYRNTSKGRSISFTVVNQMAVFTQLFTQFMTSIDDMMGTLTGPAATTTVLNASSTLVYPYSLFVQGLVPGEGESKSQITRPFDFLYNAIRGMIGAQVPASHRSIPAANFFARWARLNNFHNRFAATPFFDDLVNNPNIFPVLKALQNVAAADVIVKNLLPPTLNAGSFWDMLQLVFQTMLMEIAMIPSMPLVTVDLTSGLVQETNFAEHKLVDSFGSWVSSVRTDSRKTKPKRITNYFAKPQMLFSVPPACNAIFPSQIITLAYEENYATQPTRMYFNDETLTQVLKIPAGGLSKTIHNALSTGYPYEVDLGNRRRDNNPNLSGKNFLLYPEEYFKGPVMDRRDVPPWLYFLGQSQFADGKPTTKTADGAVNEPPPPAVTAAPRPPAAPAAVGAAMVTTGRVGRVGAGGQRVYSARVEQQRSRANKAQAATGIPADLLLAWVSHESDGKLEEVTRLNERGYFQIMGPHETKGVAKTLAQVEAGRVLHLTLEDTGADDKDGFARLSRDADFSFAQGVRLVQAYHKIANTVVDQQNLASWSEADVWRLTKLYHNAPVFAVGTDNVASFVQRAAATLGRPPASWEEMHAKISAGLSSFEANMLQNATAVGGVVAGASGQMVTQGDTKPVTAPAVQPAPATGDAAATRVAVPTVSTGPVVSTAVYDNIQRSNLTVYQLYAKYEYFRERYAKRSGSATLTWNPYVVPGFPAALFDQRASRVDLMCYVTTVQQTMSHEGNRGTTISFLYGRQFQEMFELLRKEFDEGETAAGSAPAETIRDVRKVVQSFEQAESFYQQLFYGARRLHNKDAAFDFRKIVGYAPTDDSGTPEPIFIDGPDEATQDALIAATALAQVLILAREGAEAIAALYTSKVTAADSRMAQFTIAKRAGLGDVFTDPNIDALTQERGVLLTQLAAAKAQLVSIDTRLNNALATIQGSQNTSGVSKVNHNLVGDRELVPLPDAQALFESRDAAMRYNWRPICTLDEYVIFYDAAGEGSVPAFGHPQSVGARYFDRIRRLAPPAEGFTPTASVTTAGLPIVDGLNPDNFPQTRADWDRALLAYRQNVLGVKAPRT